VNYANPTWQEPVHLALLEFIPQTTSCIRRCVRDHSESPTRTCWDRRTSRGTSRATRRDKCVEHRLFKRSSGKRYPLGFKYLKESSQQLSSMPQENRMERIHDISKSSQAEPWCGRQP